MIISNTSHKKEKECLDSPPKEPLMSLGEFLRQEREQRGISLEQVASVTRIGIRTLHALEADHYSELPALPFILGFVTSYCRFISINPKEILTKFNDYMTTKASAERPKREEGHSGYAFEKKQSGQQSRTFLLLGILGFVILGGIPILLLKPSSRQTRVSPIEKLRMAHRSYEKNIIPSPTPTPTLIHKSTFFSHLQSTLILPSATPLTSTLTHEPALPPPVPRVLATVEKASPTPTPSLTAARPLPSVSSPPSQESKEQDPLDSGLSLKLNEIQHKIIFKVLADIWVRYQVDNRPMRKFIIRKGNILVLRAKNNIKIQVSNPHSVILNYNQKGPYLMNTHPHIQMIQSNSTLFYPNDLPADMKTIFDAEKTLPQIQNSTEPKITQSTAPNGF